MKLKFSKLLGKILDESQSTFFILKKNIQLLKTYRPCNVHLICSHPCCLQLLLDDFTGGFCLGFICLDPFFPKHKYPFEPP